MKKYKVLLAEDTIEARDTIITELKKLNNFEFEIEECEFPDKAIKRLSDSDRERKYYDILFVDLDFTQQAHKGGKRNSGFEIIKKAFEVCPISKICTYSGQFREYDLSDEHQELVKKGLLVYTFDKSKKDAGIGDWFTKGIQEVLIELQNDEYLFTIFDNHKSIKETLSKKNISFQAKWELYSNLDTIITLLQSLNKISSKYILYRLIIHLYHYSLILFLTDSKDELLIKSNFEKNKSLAEKVIMPKETLTWRSQNALSQIIAESPLQKVLFGFKLNDYRNKSIHHNELFNIEFENILFANLTLSTYILNYGETNYKFFETYLSNTQKKSVKDLKLIIDYLKANQ